MTVQAPETAPAPPVSDPAAPAAPAPAAPAQQAPPAPAAPVQPAAPQQPRAADGTFAPGQQQPAAPAAPADGTDWRAEAARLRALADQKQAEADQWKAQSRRQEQRSKANHTELQQRDAVLRQIAEKVGVEFDDRPDPDVLQQRLDAQTTLARQRAVELAVYTSASASGANATAMLDSRDFMARTAALDPDAPDFTSQVADLVKEAAGQPRYQFQQPPQPTPPPTPQPQQQAPAQPPAPQPPAPSSGADFSGAPGQGSQWTQADYDRYMAGASVHDRDGKVLSEAIEKGLLVGLGIGKPRTRSRR